MNFEEPHVPGKHLAGELNEGRGATVCQLQTRPHLLVITYARRNDLADPLHTTNVCELSLDLIYQVSRLRHGHREIR